MNFKRTLPTLGFLPSEIRFYNGNGDSSAGAYGGNGDVGGEPGGGEPGQGGGGGSPGAVSGPSAPSAEPSAPSASPDPSLAEAMNILGGAYPSVQPSAPVPSAPDLGINEAMNILQGAYPSTPTSTPTPSTPSDLSDLQNSFSPPSFPKAKGLTWGKAADTAAKIGISASVFGPYSFIGSLLGLFGGSFVAITAALGLNKGKGYTPGEAIDLGLAALGVPQPTAKSKANVKAETAPTQARGTPITPSPSPYAEAKSGGLSEGLFSIPVSQKPTSYLSTYYKTTAYPSLSTSLYGTPSGQAKATGGLMIFPTSAAGIEKEGSSLLKKQQPVIDTTSLLFLLGMGALGMVLRKAK